MFPGISHNIHKYYFYTFLKICARFKLKHPFSYLWWHKLTFRFLPTIIRKIETMFINRTYQWHKIMTQLNFPNPYFVWIVKGLFNRASTCPIPFPISATQILASDLSTPSVELASDISSMWILTNRQTFYFAHIQDRTLRL